MQHEPQPNVPKYRERIDNLRLHFFSEPAKFPTNLETVIFVNGGDTMPHENKTQLKAVSPPELRDALRMAVADAVRNGESDDTLKQWRKCIQSIPVRFKATASDPEQKVSNAFESSVQQREDIGVLHANVRMSALLRSYEIMDLKSQLETGGGAKQNKKSLAQHYSKIRFAPESEKVSQTFVEHCIALHNSVLSVKEAQKHIYNAICMFPPPPTVPKRGSCFLCRPTILTLPPSLPPHHILLPPPSSHPPILSPPSHMHNDTYAVHFPSTLPPSFYVPSIAVAGAAYRLSVVRRSRLSFWILHLHVRRHGL